MMVEAGLAKELEISIWKDTLSNVVDECNAAGYKVTHDMVKLEVHFVMGEVGGGAHTKHETVIMRVSFLCPIVVTPSQKTSTKDKYFSCLVLFFWLETL